MCHRQGVCVKRQDGKVTVYPVRCKSWNCPDCQHYRARLLRAQAYEGKPDKFITITVNPHWFNSPEERCREMTKAWRDFVREWRRTHGGKRIEYMYVIERTKRGEPHMHILARSDWIPQKELSAWMARRMGAPVVDIQKPRTRRGAVRYIAKYVTKELHQFDGSKRYFRSRGWLTETLKARKARANAGASFWILPNRYSTYIRELDEKGADWISVSDDKAVYEQLPWDYFPPNCLCRDEIKIPLQDP